MSRRRRREHGPPDDEAVEDANEEPPNVIGGYVAAHVATVLVGLDQAGERARELRPPLFASIWRTSSMARVNAATLVNPIAAMISSLLLKER